MELKQAVVFAILMEGNDGIMGKAPSYIMEKLDTTSQLNTPEAILDSNNLKKFNDWKKRWMNE